MKYKVWCIIVGVLVLLSGCSNSNNTVRNAADIKSPDPETIYSDGLLLISNEEWDQAIEELNKLEPDYKGTKTLKSLVKSNIELNKVSGNELTDYKFVLEEMKNIPNKYNDVHSDLVNQYKKVLFDKISGLEQKAITQFIQQKDYDSALNLIQNSIFIYMDSSYIALNKYSYAMKKKDTNVSAYYEFLFKIPMDYSGVLHEEIKKTKGEVTAVLVDLIKKKKYEEALDITGNKIYYFETVNSDITLNAIEAVIKILKDDEDYLGLRHIPDDYNGAMSKEIKMYKKKYKKELDEFQKTLSEIERIRNQPQKLPPQIGMTAEEVNASSWGIPEDINKTTTKYGVSEQWVFSGDRYVYFDDGTVTAIQE